MWKPSLTAMPLLLWQASSTDRKADRDFLADVRGRSVVSVLAWGVEARQLQIAESR